MANSLFKRFRQWHDCCRALRRSLIGSEWWACAAASVAVSHWARHARHRRVLHAAVREATWTAAARCLEQWHLFSDVRRVGQRLDALGDSQVRQARGLRRWRERVRVCQANRLGCLAAVTFCTARVMRRWSFRAATSALGGAVLVDGTHVPVSVCADAHRYHSLLRAALSRWRLTAMTSHLALLDTERLRFAAMRRLMRVWSSMAHQQRARRARDVGRELLALARAMCTWRSAAARAPVLKLAEERILLGRAVLAFDRWRRRTQPVYVTAPMRIGVEGQHGLLRSEPARRARMPQCSQAIMSVAEGHARLADGLNALRKWQLCRIERVLWHSACQHWCQETASLALRRWYRWARATGRIRRLALIANATLAIRSLQAAMASFRHSVLVEVRAAQVRVSLLCGRRSRCKRAISKWRRASGLAAKPILWQLQRSLELAQALIMLFSWRTWRDATMSTRDSRLMSAILPALQALRRWRARARHISFVTNVWTSLSMRPRARHLPPAWHLWCERRVECQYAARIDALGARANRRAKGRRLWQALRHVQAQGNETCSTLEHAALRAAKRVVQRWRSAVRIQVEHTQKSRATQTLVLRHSYHRWQECWRARLARCAYATHWHPKSMHSALLHWRSECVILPERGRPTLASSRLLMRGGLEYGRRAQMHSAFASFCHILRRAMTVRQAKDAGRRRILHWAMRCIRNVAHRTTASIFLSTLLGGRLDQTIGPYVHDLLHEPPSYPQSLEQHDRAMADLCTPAPRPHASAPSLIPLPHGPSGPIGGVGNLSRSTLYRRTPSTRPPPQPLPRRGTSLSGVSPSPLWLKSVWQRAV